MEGFAIEDAVALALSRPANALARLQQRIEVRVAFQPRQQLRRDVHSVVVVLAIAPLITAAVAVAAWRQYDVAAGTTRIDAGAELRLGVAQSGAAKAIVAMDSARRGVRLRRIIVDLQSFPCSQTVTVRFVVEIDDEEIGFLA